MSKDYALVIVDNKTEEVVDFQRLYEEETAERIGRKYVREGQTAFVFQLKSMWAAVPKSLQVAGVTKDEN